MGESEQRPTMRYNAAAKIKRQGNTAETLRSLVVYWGQEHENMLCADQ